MRWFLLCLTLVAGGPALAADDIPQMTVTGVGEVAAVPDMATLRLGVFEQAETAGAAMDVVSDVTGRMIEVLGDAGLAPRDMQTTGLSLNPVWQSDANGPGRVVGFEAENELTVRVRDLDKVGEVLDAVLGVGGNLFRGLSFGLQDPQPAADEARRRAVADAARKAALYAEAAGVTLGPILSIDEGGASAPMPMMERALMAEAPMPVAEGEVTTAARVTVVYRLAE